MTTENPKQILNNLYGLMMEINFHRPEEEVLEELQAKPDPVVEKHLLKVKQLTAKYKAEVNKNRYRAVVEQLKKLKEKGAEELKKFLNPHQQLQLQPLFRKFEELTPEDELSILEDQELLALMEALHKSAKEDE